MTSSEPLSRRPAKRRVSEPQKTPCARIKHSAQRCSQWSNCYYYYYFPVYPQGCSKAWM